MDSRYWDLRDLVDRWVSFLLGIIRASIDVGFSTGGMAGLFIGIIAVTVATLVVGIPLILASLLWLIVVVLGAGRRRRIESETGEPLVNKNWRED